MSLMTESKDVDRVIDVLRSMFPGGSPQFRLDNWPCPALNVLDCVLSLNRNYKHFCKPKVAKFADTHQEVQSLDELLRLIERHKTPLEFSQKELEYNDKRRAGVLVGVTKYLISAQEIFDGETEMRRLGRWAVSVTSRDYKTPGVPGFALSGFQYLRILFGADTAKPDVHIRRFASEAVGRKIGDEKALALLEAAAARLGWSLCAVDHEIWETRAEKKKPSSAECPMREKIVEAG